MGYGEAGGGGSVHWEVRYDDTNKPQAVDDPKKRKKREAPGGNMDEDDSTVEGSSLFVVCTEAKVIEDADGKVIVRVRLQDKSDQVRLYWGVDSGHAFS